MYKFNVLKYLIFKYKNNIILLILLYILYTSICISIDRYNYKTSPKYFVVYASTVYCSGCMIKAAASDYAFFKINFYLFFI